MRKKQFRFDLGIEEIAAAWQFHKFYKSAKRTMVKVLNIHNCSKCSEKFTLSAMLFFGVTLFPAIAIIN